MKRRVVSAMIAIALVISMIPVVTAAEVGMDVSKDYLYNSTKQISTENYGYISAEEEEEIKNYPEIQSIVPVQNGFNVSWNGFEGASGYILFVKSNGSDWKKVGYTTDLTLTHTGLKNNTEYTYTVIASDNDGAYVSDYYSEGWSNKYLTVPSLTSVKSVYGGMKITWDKVTGAEKYRVFVKNGSSWKTLGDTTALSFTDKSVTSGKKYTYTVRCIASDGKAFTSYYNKSGKSGTYVAAPAITKIENISNGSKITWNKVSSAAKYRLYVKSNGSNWKKVGDTTSLTLTHTGLKNNTEYIYTVRALDKNGTIVSDYYRQGWSNKYLTVPSLTSVKSVYGGMKITWDKVTGAEKYRVFVKNGSSWKTLGDTTSLSFTDKSVTSGKKYTYTVRCIASDGKAFTSYYNKSGKSGTYVAAPAITKIENISNGSKITWNKVSGAAKYRLYVKSNGSNWKKVGDTTSLTLTHTGLKNNTEYIYTVRALDKNGTLVSDYYRQGWSNKYLTVPALTSVGSVYGGMKITWNKVAGAEKYRVFVKNGSSWKTLGDTTSLSFTDKSVTSGKKYTYTVRCITSDGKAFTSYYNKSGKSGTYVAAPAITKIENISNGSKITWNKAAGAAKYRLFVKNGSTWKKVGDTASTSFSHTGLADGSTYTYTVRALNSNGGYASGYYSSGWSNRYIAPPAISSIIKTDEGTVLKWNAVATADGYRVYRKSFGGSWSMLADVTNTSYTDTSATSNTLYTYTIRCLDANGKLISYYIADTKYYYNGVLANGKITANGKTYNFKDGRLQQGYVTINGATYYYNSAGVLQTNGIVGSKKEGYCYADKNGKIDYSFTGVAKNSAGYWYCIKGKVDLTYRNGVTYSGADWNVLDGKATKVSTEADRTLFRALKLVAKVTDSSMTKSEKLKVCFDYVKKAYTEKNPRIPHYTGMDWPVIYANDMFVNGAGNCFSYAAAFAYMAKAIGYEEVYCCSSGGHGWAEINGLVYDPEWSRHSSASTYYGISYNAKTDVNYKGAISPGYAWMHIKI